MQTANNNILALDVGDQRIGVAIAGSISRIASPLTTLPNSGDIIETLRKTISENQVSALVVGLPRGIDGQETAQTKLTREFADRLKTALDIPIYLQDEAVTSLRAEAELNQRKTGYRKEDIDALAACYILDDFMREGKLEEL